LVITIIGGTGSPIDSPRDVVLGPSGTLFVAGGFSDNVVMVEADGTIAEIITAAGDGAGNSLDSTSGIAVADSSVYVSGFESRNAFRVTFAPVFDDGFEAGDTGAWSATVP